MNKRIIAVCDSNKKYVMGISSMLMARKKEPYEIVTFTSVDNLVDYSRENKLEALVITEASYEEKISLASPKVLIILRDNPDFVLEGAVLIDRYQSREDILISVMDSLPECDEHFSRRLKTHKWKVVGVYSPVRRCLQTTFAMTLGQALGKKHKVLYMNFENYSGLSGLLNKEFTSDIIDLLYFFDCDRDKLAHRLETTVHNLNGMDILPPAESYLDTYERTGTKWIDFLEAIGDVSEYEFLILDLTDSMQGLVDVLSYCDRIYTMVKNDSISRAKLSQYETWMARHSYAEIISKTMKFNFPQFSDMPANPEMLTKSELAGYVRTIIKEDIDENE